MWRHESNEVFAPQFVSGHCVHHSSSNSGQLVRGYLQNQRWVKDQSSASVGDSSQKLETWGTLLSFQAVQQVTECPFQWLSLYKPFPHSSAGLCFQVTQLEWEISQRSLLLCGVLEGEVSWFWFSFRDFLKLFSGIYFLSLMSFMKDGKFHLLIEQPVTFPHASTLQCLPCLHVIKSVPDDQAVLLRSTPSITVNTQGGCRAEDSEPRSQ